MNRFDEKEFRDICKKLRAKPTVREATISYEQSSFFNKVKTSVVLDRRGEVVFCVIRPSGKVIAVTCDEYPEGVFRIPTGGIGKNEDIVDAVFRETKEELGLETEIVSFAGVLKIRLEHGDDSVMFYSYIFIMRETGGSLLKDASDDEISEVKEVDLKELESIVDKLKNIKGRWSDWGRFRYESSKAVLDYLKESNILG